MIDLEFILNPTVDRLSIAIQTKITLWVRMLLVSEQKKRHFLICGLGSIGKRHLEKVVSSANNVIVIDPDVGIKTYLASNPQYAEVQYFESFTSLKLNLSDYICVVSNWGPDHFATVNEARNLNCVRFLIEKPLVSRIDTLFDLKDLAEMNRIEVISSLPWSYSTLVQRISELSFKHNLGAITSIVVDGGAKCLVTNGIHYVGLAMKLFKFVPLSVISSLHNSFVNPRQSHFQFIEGTSAWTFPENRFLTINFVNSSHLQISIKIVFAFGKLLIEGNEATLFAISDEDKALIDKPSRTYHARKLIEKFELFDLDSRVDPLDLIYQNICDNDSSLWLDFRHGFDTTEAILAMLISQEEKARIDLPLALNLVEKYKTHEWHIS